MDVVAWLRLKNVRLPNMLNKEWKNSKSQAPNFKQIPNPNFKIQNKPLASVLNIGILVLFGICDLEFGIYKSIEY